MNFSSINWLAVIACVAASMIIGSIWFGPKTFFPMWWKAIGKSESDDPKMLPGGMTWILTIAASFVQAVFMSLIVTAMGSMTGGATLVSGATAGFFSVAWLCRAIKPDEQNLLGSIQGLGAGGRQSSGDLCGDGRDSRRVALNA